MACSRVQMLNWPACCSELSPTKNIWHIRTFVKNNQGLVKSWDPTSDMNGTIFPKSPTTGLSSYRLLLKEDQMLHSGKHGPFSLFGDVLMHKIQNCLMKNVQQYKQLICLQYLCSIGNIQIYEIFNLLHFVFVYILHNIHSFSKLILKVYIHKCLTAIPGHDYV